MICNIFCRTKSDYVETKTSEDLCFGGFFNELIQKLSFYLSFLQAQTM